MAERVKLSRISQLTLDVTDVALMADFWSGALGYRAERGTDGSVDEEVDRLLALGATHADVGQSAEDPFVVLADPEGNEFCVLRNRPRG